jgi:type IV secretory pathway VirB10-like protein
MTDERDPQVSRRYRELGSEQPPRALDDAILSAARAPMAPHAPLVTPAGRHRWYFGLAAAAVLVLSVAVTLHMERQAPDESLVPSAPPAQPPAAVTKNELAPPPIGEAAPKAPAPQKPRLPAPSEPRFSPAPPPSPVAPKADQRAAERTDAKETAKLRAEQAASRPAAPAMARAAPDVSDRDLSPERELERIAEMRRAGKHDEADKALAEFRRRYPDYAIPHASLERVERK